MRGGLLTGMWFEDRVLELAAAGRRMNEAADFSSMLAIIRGGEASLAALQRMHDRREEFTDAWLEAGAVRLLAPIPAPVRNVFCVGRNYADHVKEGYAKAGKEVKLPGGAAVLHQGHRGGQRSRRRRAARPARHAPARLRSGAGGGHRHGAGATSRPLAPTSMCLATAC